MYVSKREFYSPHTARTISSVRIAVDGGRFAPSASLLKARGFLIAPGLLGSRLFGIRLVVMASVALALARGDHSDFVRPVGSVRTPELYPLSAGVSGDAAVVGRTAPPPFSPQNRIWHQVRWKALTGTHQFLHRLDAAARSVGNVARRAQLPAAQFRGSYTAHERKEENG